MNGIHQDDAFWERQPTALEVAHYNAVLTRTANDASERARKIFGDCLLKLLHLGMKETNARSMLGRWRSQAKDDALLIRVIEAAHKMGTPDPVSYVTKAIKAAKSRGAQTVALQKSSWTLLGWEAPRAGSTEPTFKGAVRGQVWRDPFGKETVLPPKEGTVPPTIDEDPGYQLKRSDQAA